MSHLWSVREDRHILEKMPGKEPLLTGQKILSPLFPSVLGRTYTNRWSTFSCENACISKTLLNFPLVEILVI